MVAVRYIKVNLNTKILLVPQNGVRFREMSAVKRSVQSMMRSLLFELTDKQKHFYCSVTFVKSTDEGSCQAPEIYLELYCFKISNGLKKSKYIQYRYKLSILNLYIEKLLVWWHKLPLIIELTALIMLPNFSNEKNTNYNL